MKIAIFIIATIIAIAIIQHIKTKRRIKLLMEKYNDIDTVKSIMKKLIWQGMSEEQLIDSWGSPAEKDHKVYKKKISKTYKYNQTGKNRFGNRVQLENGIVVGWNKR